ncbi:extracellular solute-binding protein [Paenibacillus sp. BK720]|uniref:extracellular solute-binding protein n=1 Tax=Paenibacillus sp. BK720 TaxID=2587092 RepID=UPI00141E60E8|nr:extracellular solute-binding protein [Paenibacillus sp. BK720]NIK69607.1 putative aldouronate transport system substrate-binding protein [Paenibacillus sp. BK720]
MRKRALSYALLAAMAIGFLGGCSSGSGNEADGAASADAGKADTGKQVTLKVGIFDRGNAPAGYTATDNYWTDYVQKNFGDPNHIKVEFVPIPRNDASDKVNVMMTSGDAPDIVFASTNVLTPYGYAKDGGLLPLDSLIDQYGPNLKTYLGDALDVGKVDGVQYSIPGRRVNTGKYENLIRKDWLDKLGLPMPQTTEQVYETLKAFKEKDPGQTGGKVIPLGLSLTPASLEPIVWSFIQDGLTDEQRYTLSENLGYPLLLPGHKDAVKFLNKLYNEGLVSPDFALDKDEKQVFQDVMNGKVGMYSDNLGNAYADNPGIAKVLTQNVPGANLVPVDPYTNNAGKHLKPEYDPTGFFLMVPASSKRGVEAIKYLDWMAQPDVLLTLMNGIEGEDYTMVDGLPQRVQSDETSKRMFNSADMAMITQGEDFGSNEKNWAAAAAAVPEPFRKSVIDAYKMSLTDTTRYANFTTPIEAENKYMPALRDKYDQLIVKSIMAKPADFDKVYEDLLKDYMASGGDAIVKERTEAYKAMEK